MGRGKNIDTYIAESIRNIREDRATVKVLLIDLLAEIKKTDLQHKEVGLVAAKYVETLQRSNEQLVKITALLQKETKESLDLSSEDKQELFDLISSDSAEEIS